jgi:hypothetical protein
MLSFSRIVRLALVAVALVALTACSGLRPVYSDAGLGAGEIKVRYAAPANRLEQIIYQELALKVGKGRDENESIPTVTVAASASYPSITNGSVSSPNSSKQAVVNAQLTVTAPDGTVLFSGQRSQTADFQASGQALANRQAEDSAARQAAVLLSDTLKLQIMAALSKWQH